MDNAAQPMPVWGPGGLEDQKVHPVPQVPAGKGTDAPSQPQGDKDYQRSMCAEKPPGGGGASAAQPASPPLGGAAHDGGTGGASPPQGGPEPVWPDDLPDTWHAGIMLPDGRELAEPGKRWDGTLLQWWDVVKALVPGQCSYPDGGVLTKQTRQPCRAKPAGPSGRCKFHGGMSPVGQAHPSTKHGRYSRYLPTKLAALYMEAEADPELLSLKGDVSLLEARIKLLCERLNTGEAGLLWPELRKLYAKARAAIQANDPQALDDHLHALGEVIDKGATQEEVWAEIQDTLEGKSRITAKENLRMKDLQQYMTMQQAMTLMGFLVDCVVRHVDDRQIVRRIHDDFGKVLSSPIAKTGPQRAGVALIQGPEVPGEWSSPPQGG